MGLLDPPAFPLSTEAKAVFGRNAAPALADVQGVRNLEQNWSMADQVGVVARPAAFTFNPGFEIMRTAKGDFYSTANARNFRPASGITLYVDIVNGSDANNGSTWALAFKTLAGALASTAYGTGTIPCLILVAGGLYTKAQGMNSLPLKRDTSVVGVGEFARFTGATSGTELVWTAEPGVGANIYSAPWAEANGRLVDERFLDAYGDPYVYASSSSLVNLAAATRGYRIEGGKIYVKLQLGGAPDNSVLISSILTSNFPNTIAAASNGFTFYTENTSWEAAQYGFRANTGTGNTIFYNCRFRNNMVKGFESERVGLTFLESCESRRNFQDGISYRSTATAVELNCSAIRNGWTSTGIFIGPDSNNGSTCHDTSKVIRINGTYLQNLDRNVHDVDGSRSWNLGCTAGNAQQPTHGGDPYLNSDWVCGTPSSPGSSAGMWLDSCASFGSVGNYNNYGAIGFFLRRCGPVVGIRTGTGFASY